MSRLPHRRKDEQVTFYNENDPKTATWLAELIADGHIPVGRIDKRSIVEVHVSDCAPTSHFFAGIGGWPYALRLAGWPEDRPIWTGSCPCQPFSAAGKHLGTADVRHLWPEWLRLIRKCHPPTIFGEQVASRAGREWLAGVRADLEALGYAVGAADLCAASTGAPHIRQRLFWVAVSDEAGYETIQRRIADEVCRDRASIGAQRGSECSGTDGGVGDTSLSGVGSFKGQSREGAGREISAGGSSVHGRLGDAEQPRLQGLAGNGAGCDGYLRQVSQPHRPVGASGDAFDAWDRYDLIPCADGKSRRVESGTFPLAHGVPARVGRLRGYGNGIVAQVAAVFVRAFMEVENG